MREVDEETRVGNLLGLFTRATEENPDPSKNMKLLHSHLLPSPSSLPFPTFPPLAPPPLLRHAAAAMTSLFSTRGRNPGHMLPRSFRSHWIRRRDQS